MGEKVKDKVDRPGPGVQVDRTVEAPTLDTGPARVTVPARTVARTAEQAVGGGRIHRARTAAALQRSAGNRRTGELMRCPASPPTTPVQAAPALGVSHPQDATEREAESIGRTVAAGGRATPTVAMPTGSAARAAPDPAVPDPAAATAALGRTGPGRPMPDPTRRTLEPALGADLGHVRVHDDPAAQEAATALGARAFTHGDDIWLGPDASPDDTELMAHEATHVLQQQSTPSPLLHRAPAKGNGKPKPKPKTKAPTKPLKPLTEPFSEKMGTIGKDTIELAVIQVPTVKAAATDLPLTVRPEGKRPRNQLAIWRRKAKAVTALADKINDKIANAPDIRLGGKRVYCLKVKSQDIFVVGDMDTIRNQVTVPGWDKSGGSASFDVDHKKEYQLGGDHDVPNFWLWQRSANRSSGPRINNQINERVQALLNAAREDGWNVLEHAEAARKRYTVTARKVEGGLEVTGKPEVSWEWDEITTKGEQLNALEVLLTAQQIGDCGLKGSPNRLAIYLSEYGYARHCVEWGEGVTKKAYEDDKFLDRTPFRLTEIKWAVGGANELTGQAFRGNEYFNDPRLTFKIKDRPGIQYGGHISEESVKQAFGAGLEAKGFSPVEIDEAELVDGVGLVARGRLLPDIPFFEKLAIDLVIEGDKVQLERTFEPADIRPFGPFRITDSSLTLFAGTAGFGARGEVKFAIDKVGQGQLCAKVSTEGLELHGGFDFEAELFDPARIDAHYVKGKGFSAAGKLGIKPGAVSGIRKADIAAKFEQGKLDATGTAEFDIPGLRQGTLTLAYSEKEGLAISGALELSPSPILRGGTVTADVRRAPDGDRYVVSARGTAYPAIPGVDTALTVAYDDGILTIEAQAAYAKGRLKGSLLLGATNRKLGADGLPVAATPGAAAPRGEGTGPLVAYGRGSATLRITPWLEGTVGVRILPQGELELTGKIAVPDAVTLFDAKTLDKRLLDFPTIDIPIVGVALLGKRIGIFATIGGGLDADSSIGPGQIRGLGLEVTYNPSREEEAKVSGGGQLYIPASAGIRLYVKGAVGASLLVVSAEGGIELGGRLGLQGALQADLKVNWTPAKGLVVDQTVEISAEPAFRFDITGYVLVQAGLLLKTELYSKRWTLKSFEWGSGMRVGVRLPIHYEEGKDFSGSLSDVEFAYPRIDGKQVVGDLVAKLA